MDADLAAIARQFEEQEATLADLQQRAHAHADVTFRVGTELDEQFGAVLEKLSRTARPAPRVGIRV